MIDQYRDQARSELEGKVEERARELMVNDAQGLEENLLRLEEQMRQDRERLEGIRNFLASQAEGETASEPQADGNGEG
jgi:hypothetical protein